MSSDYYYHFDKERLKVCVLLAKSTNIIKHTSYVDKVPETFKRREYIIDKIYEPRKSVEIK